MAETNDTGQEGRRKFTEIFEEGRIIIRDIERHNKDFGRAIDEIKQRCDEEIKPRMRELASLTSRLVAIDKMERKRKKIKIAVFSFAAVIVVVFSYWLAMEVRYERTTIGKLETKIEEVSELKGKIRLKYNEVVQLDVSYENKMDVLSGEVRSISRNNNVSTYSRAVRNQQIRNRLILLQQLFAYKELIGITKEQLDAGYEEADFLGRKTENDLGVARVFTGDSRNDLIEEIDKVISKYSAAADMDVSNLTITENAQLKRSLEDVWKWVNQR